MAIAYYQPYKNAATQMGMLYTGSAPSRQSNQTRRNMYPTSYTQKRRRLMPRNSFKNEMMKNTPAKHDTFGPATALLHQTVYSVNVTEQITQSTTNEGRIGDSIFLEALKIRGIYTSAAAANAYNCRVIVGFSGEEYATGANLNPAGLVAGEVFLPGAPSNFTALINPKAFTCLYDQVFDVNSQLALTRDVSSVIANIPLKQKFLYQSSGSIQGKTKNLYIVVVSNVFGGTSGTTSTGEIVLGVDTIFK